MVHILKGEIPTRLFAISTKRVDCIGLRAKSIISHVNTGGLCGHTSTDDNINLQVISFSHSILERILSAIPGNVIRRKRLPADGNTILVLSAAPLLLVVLWSDFDAGLSRRIQLCNDITPWLVVVNSEGDNKVFAGVSYETERATSATAAHREEVCVFDFLPGAIRKNCLFDRREKSIRIGLVDLYSDRVGHSVYLLSGYIKTMSSDGTLIAW